MINVHVVLNSGHEFIVEVEETPRAAAESVWRRLERGVSIAARPLSEPEQYYYYIFPKENVRTVAAKVLDNE